MMEIQGLRDKIVDRLSATSGEQLEITCNITSNKQIDLFVEEMALNYLGSGYIKFRGDMMKRLTNSYQGKARNDLVEIGRTPEFKVGNASFEDQ